MVLRLLSNVCVPTPFYQLPEYHVYSFLRNLLYLIHDNAVIESFFSCLKSECIHLLPKMKAKK